MIANGFATGQETVGNTATPICAARSDRQKVTIVNHGTTDVYLGGDDVATATGILLTGTAGAQVTLETTAAIYGIVGTGTQAVSFAEVFA